MSARFCHLHNHTEYSLLDGANRVEDLVARAVELEMPAIAISDHGVMFGVMNFYWECKKKGIKPIIGVEAYVAPNHLERKGDREKNAYHLLLLAKDLEGYRNLCTLSTIAALDGFYHKPRIDHELLSKHSKGLIGTSACLGSEICQELLRDHYDKAQYIAGKYVEILGQDNFYIELQDHGLTEQKAIKEPLMKIARELKLPLIATNDAHYLRKEDSKPHDVLLCIQTGALVENEKRLKFKTDEFYLKTPDEMARLFSDVPEALANTIEIADRCELNLESQSAPMPQPQVPEGKDSVGFLRALTEDGLRRRGLDGDAAKNRADFELDVITRTGFVDYFLLVREFAEATRQRDIHFGVRGSAAGSLVSYCVGITDVDPLEYGLSFERFLNPERVSMPDVDMDFEDERRGEIIRYVTERFGKNHVAQIITFGTLGAKASIRDCGRVLGFKPQETDRLAKLVPGGIGVKLSEAMTESGELAREAKANPSVKLLLETALRVEGLTRNAGTHAAGVVISRQPLSDFIPLYRGSDGQPVTGFEMGVLEKLGMLKMDFLGLSNLSVIARCVRLVKKTRKIDLDLTNIPDGDKRTYEMLGRGETVGVFQLEGSEMTGWITRLKPESIKELAAMVALYRPGPKDHIGEYIDAKYGRIEPKYPHEAMRPILSESFGVIVFQDQVMELAKALSGFSLGKADNLRRAISKKDSIAMESLKIEFVNGCAANGIDRRISEEIWTALLPFAGYGFNKAHAVCYAILAYQTAYLKANFGIEYLASMLSVFLGDGNRVTVLIEECRKMGIKVVGPSINASQGEFAIESVDPGVDSCIRFGLLAIKGIGRSIVERMVQEREANGNFSHLFEFCKRGRAVGVQKSNLEAMIKAGALDEFGQNRKTLMDYADAGMLYADQARRNSAMGQESLFLGDEKASDSVFPVLPESEEFDRMEKLQMEREVLGTYVSDHPLRGLNRQFTGTRSQSIAQMLEQREESEATVSGIIVKIESRTTKSSGKEMATLVLEDLTGQVSCTLLPANYKRYRDEVSEGSIVTITGHVYRRDKMPDSEAMLRVETVKSISMECYADASTSSKDKSVWIYVQRATEAQLHSLKLALDSCPGNDRAILQLLPERQYKPISLECRVETSDIFLTRVQSCIPDARVEVEEMR